ncbi:MAG: CYTH domain-containing protein [Magnetococcales bacterium]|nr:CYTH domain-containing protein [Magnetococcales bacterium]
MAQEIERRFLVDDRIWHQQGRAQARTATRIRQGFLSTVKERVVRVRQAGEQATLTIKGITRGIAKQEFEYAIPLADAQTMLEQLCLPPLIDKIRYQVEVAGLLWEVDEFAGLNQGLILAEVELISEEQAVVLPAWIAREVSDDPRYFNSSLISKPFSTW